MSTATGRWGRFLPFLRWPLVRYREQVDLSEPDGGLKEHVGSAAHGLRLQRYWWAASALADAASRSSGRFVIVDLGCERGWMKRFTAPNPKMEWIGVDGNASHPALAASRYDRVIEANFDDRLPLPDGIADAVVSLHVFEHLRHPEFAAREVARILKPGGIFLAGSPTAPSPISWIRTRMLQARDRRGENRRWGHIRKLSPADWSRCCSAAGLELEFLTGSHLIRRSGSRLEDRAWWVRFNQVWGGLFPSLGQEVYLCARKPSTDAVATSGRWLQAWLRCDWVVLVTVLAMMIAAIGMIIGGMGSTSVREVMARNQDGNDDFAWSSMTAAPKPRGAERLEVIESCVTCIPEAFEKRERAGRDLHLIVEMEDARAIAGWPAGLDLHVADVWSEGSRRFVVLSRERDNPTLSDFLHAGQ